MNGLILIARIIHLLVEKIDISGEIVEVLPDSLLFYTEIVHKDLLNIPSVRVRFSLYLTPLGVIIADGGLVSAFIRLF